MPAYIYLGDSEGRTPTSNPEIDTLIAKLRERTQDDWRVLERTCRGPRTGFWRRRTTVMRYELMRGTGDKEFQMVNFWAPRGSSMNFFVSAEVLVAYLDGLLSYSPSSHP